MTVVTVRHRTVYRYANPVQFGPHRMMLRPRDSHDLRLLETNLAIQPAASVRWLHDVFGNSVAVASFGDAGQELVFDSTIRLEQFPVAERELMLDVYAQRYPFSYPVEEIPDLARMIERAYPDPWHKVDTWARWFVEERPQPQHARYPHRDDPIDPIPVRLRAARGDGNANPSANAGKRLGQLPRLCALHDGGGSQPGSRGAVRVGLPLQPEAGRRRKLSLSAVGRPMPGCRSICQARVGSSSIRPMGWWAATT